MPDRVENELRRVTTALAEISPPRPELAMFGKARQRRRSGLLIALASFALVLVIGLVTSLVNREDLPVGIVPVPDGHSALVALERDIAYDVIPEFASERGAFFLCGSGGSLRACVIWEDRIAVIIPYSVSDGVSGEVRTTSHDGPLEIPLVEGELVGVRHDSGRFILIYRVPGEETPFSLGTDFPSSEDS